MHGYGKNKACVRAKRSYRVLLALALMLILLTAVIYLRFGALAACSCLVYGAAAAMLLSLLVSAAASAAETERRRAEETLPAEKGGAAPCFFRI